MEKIRKQMYPYYLKKIERNKNTDINFYRILSPRTFIQISFDADDVVIGKYTIWLKGYSTKKDFADRYTFIKIDEAEFKEVQLKALNSFYNISEDERMKEAQKILKNLKSATAELKKIKNTLREI